MYFRKKILYVENSSELGGGNISLLLILDHLDRNLYEPMVACPTNGPMVREISKRSIPNSVISNDGPKTFWPFSFIKSILQYQKLILQNKIDLVHVNDTAAYLCIGSALKQRPVPCICHVRFPYTENDIAYIAKHTRWPNVLLFNSYAMERQLGPLVDMYMPGVHRKVIHNALDTDLFSFVEDPYEAKVHYGIEPDRFVVSIVANFTPAKDHETFLRMAKEVLVDFPGTLFVLAGSDALHDGNRLLELRKLAVDLGVDEALLFTGFVDDVRSIIAMSDLVVCSSVVETFGRCLVEAMSCGKPVVASKVGGIPEIIDDGNVGILVQPRDVKGFANAVCRLLKDHELHKKMGIAARDHVVKNFGVHIHMDNIINLYRDVTNMSVK